jgi:hypothetical protein
MNSSRPSSTSTGFDRLGAAESFEQGNYAESLPTKLPGAAFSAGLRPSVEPTPRVSFPGSPRGWHRTAASDPVASCEHDVDGRTSPSGTAAIVARKLSTTWGTVPS